MQIVKAFYILALLTVIGSISLFTGCKDSLKDAAKSIENASDSLGDGLAELAKVDPLGLQKLLDENQELREKLAKLASQLTAYTSGMGVVVLEGKRLQIHVSQYTGSHRVNAWVDTKENWVRQNTRFNNKNIRLPVDCEQIARSGMNDDAPWPNLTARAIFIGALAPHSEVLQFIVGKCRTEVDSKFQTFLKDSAIVPAPDDRFIDLHDSMGGSGPHHIGIVVTPIAADKNGRWSLRGELIQTSPDGSRQRIKDFDVDSDFYAGHTLGEPLPEVSVFVRTKSE